MDSHIPSHIPSLLPRKPRVNYVETESTTATARAGKPNLLFVDDEERILRTLKMLFSQHYNVRTTTSGYEALDILKTEKIHALISDQRMPIMLGVDLLRQAKNISPNTMRLLLTGYSDLEAITGSINEGEIFRYVNKPWDAEEIKSTVSCAVDIALSLEQVEATIPPAANSPCTGHILVIDEDPDSAAAIDAILDANRPGQYIVEWAHNLEMVLDILEHQEVVLVIAEARLGSMDLTDLVKQLKQHNPYLITILLTTFRDATMLISMVNQAQIFRFLPKPLRSNLTWLAIKGGLERAQMLKDAPKLAARHRVEIKPMPPRNQENPVAKRLMGFFARFGKAS